MKKNNAFFTKISFDPKLETASNSDASMHYPGLAPFEGGPYASMYMQRPWTIRQYAGFSTAEASNQFYKDNLKAGQKGLSVAFDLPTHRGYDSDHMLAKADVGKAGVAIDTVEDMKILFEGIPLDQISVSMTMNGAVIPILAYYIVAAEEQGVSKELLTGTIQNDILKEFLVRNTYIYPPEFSLRIVTDIFKYTSKYMPRFNAISVSGYHMLEAGAPPHVELAYTLADGFEYLQRGIQAGLDIEDFAPRISFFFGIGMNIWNEVAKLRAARILWAELVESLGGIADKSKTLRTHCQTSGWSLTVQDIDNNITRTTLEAIASILGGTQSLHTNSKDEAISLPTVESAAIARDTQLILNKQTNLTNWPDIVGESNQIKTLVDQLIKESKILINEVLATGGMTKAIANGLPKRKIEEFAAARQAQIDSGEEKIIGLNLFKPIEEDPIPVLKIEHEKVIAAQLNRLEAIKKNRRTKDVNQALNQLTKACTSSQSNILEVAIQAAKKRATLGEISMAIEKAYGRYNAPVTTSIHIYGKQSKNNPFFKKAVQKVKAFEKKYGRRPRILIAKLGQDGHDRGAKIIAAGFADIGFDVDMGPLFQSPAQVIKQALENDVHMIGVSSLAGAHAVLVPELLDTLQKASASHIQVIVGGIIPSADHEFLFNKGVLAIFGPGTNLAEAAYSILKWY